MANPTNIALLGVPMESGAGRPGCLMGPASYRTAGLAEALRGLGHRVEDLGDLTPGPPPATAKPHAVVKNAPEAAGWIAALQAKALKLASADAFPIYMGGDHSLALGSVGGHAAAARAEGRPLHLLWLDAHADFNTFETTDSGNIHGMPLAYICGQPGYETWTGAPFLAPLDPRDVAVIGLRSVDDRERELIAGEGVALHDMRAIDENGISRLLAPFLERAAAANALLHVSLDVDFLDPDIAPAVGTTVPGGATYREAHLVMEMLHDSGLATSLDLVELNPFLDMRGQTASLMVDLTASLFGRRVIDRPSRSFGA